MTGTLNNSGAVNDQAGGLIANAGTFDNSGLVTVFAGAAINGSGVTPKAAALRRSRATSHREMCPYRVVRFRSPGAM